MRTVIPSKLERGRVRHGYFASDSSWGTQGAFFIDRGSVELKIIACDGSDEEAHGWEHVSVSCKNRCPNWAEMSFVKELFWQDNETVLQFHPAKSEYINNHPYCLHLWRKVGEDAELPPAALIGVKEDVA